MCIGPADDNWILFKTAAKNEGCIQKGFICLIVQYHSYLTFTPPAELTIKMRKCLINIQICWCVVHVWLMANINLYI